MNKHNSNKNQPIRIPNQEKHSQPHRLPPCWITWLMEGNLKA